jgi:X-Pro dipeptidyl-peptidase
VSTWVPRGFAVVHSESPGTGLSQGCPTVGGPNEELAPKAVIDWLNGRAKGYTTIDGNEEVKATWSTGKVGMTGTSYNGTLPLAAATTGVKGLEAIIPISPNTSYYHYYRSNGLVRHPGGWLGEDMDFLYDFINSGNPDRRDWCNAHVREGDLKAHHDRTTGDWNDFWARRDYWGKLDGVKAATLMAHGLNDWNVMPIHSVHVAKVLEARGVPVQMYFHQGGHGGPPPLAMMNRWFTRYLYDVKNGVENEPKAWIVREDAPRDEPTPYADYPLPGAAPVALHPTGDGNGVGTLAMAATAEPTIGALVDDVDSNSVAWAQTPRSEHRLIYATPELTQPLHISGAPKVTVRVAVNKPAANLSVYLVELPYTTPERRKPDFSLVTRGWADLQNHASLEHGEPLVPGQFYEMTFDLQPDDQVIPAGKRLALMIFSSDRDFTLWPAPGTELQVDLAGTSITLPVVGGPQAFAAATTTP